jgi:imidazolonepropionase
MTRRAVVGHGRLLTMAGERATETGPLEGPWVLAIEDGRIAEVRRGELRAGDPEQVDDAGGALVTPGLVDPHTHLIYAGDRADEAAARSRGEHYSSGGILRTVTATNAATDTELVASLQARLAKARAGGTTTIEVKSGYGLEAGAELRLLRLIGEAARGLPLRVRRTYLGAHAVPPGLTAAEASAAVTAAIPTVAGEADHIDVFCEPGLFDLEQTRAIARAGAAEGLPLKLHADQLRRSGAALLGVELGALSVDHLEQLAPADVPVLAASPTVATILPGPALMLRAGTPPARELLDAGAVVAIGSDANAGTFGEPSMPLVVGLAVALGFTIDEALRAATVGAATALGLAGQVGRLAPGAAADLVAWDAEHEGAFAHRLGDVAPHRTWYGGECHD